MKGACSATKLAIFSDSELCETKSAIDPSAAIMLPLGTKANALEPLIPIPAALAPLYIFAPYPATLAVAPVAPPIPPVAAVSTPNSINPLASLPSAVWFSGTQSSGISNHAASPCT